MSKLVEKRDLGHGSVEIVPRDETGAGAPKEIIADSGARRIAPRAYATQGGCCVHLTSPGLKPNPDTGKLEPTRPLSVTHL